MGRILHKIMLNTKSYLQKVIFTKKLYLQIHWITKTDNNEIFTINYNRTPLIFNWFYVWTEYWEKIILNNVSNSHKLVTWANLLRKRNIERCYFFTINYYCTPLILIDFYVWTEYWEKIMLIKVSNSHKLDITLVERCREH